MTSASGYYPFRDLVQAYSVADLRYVPTRMPKYNHDSIMGFLQDSGNFTILTYLFRIAQMDMLADQRQFHSTLFACPDEILRQQFGGEEYFMNLDRGEIRKLINFHILPLPVYEETLRDQTLSILNTRHDILKLTLINEGKDKPLRINGNQNRGECTIISPNIVRNNGVVYVIDRLLLP